jgi:molybdopterin adenylyltransferase
MAHSGPHDHHARDRRVVDCAVLTASDTRTPETDRSGQRMHALLEAAGHRVTAYAILPDDPVRIGAQLDQWLADPMVHAVLVNGGTGLAPRDTTYEAVVARLEKRLDGFGELFRRLSFDEIGAAAMLSRAIAGVARGRFVASVPGSTAAVELAMTRLLVPQLGHIATLLAS